MIKGELCNICYLSFAISSERLRIGEKTMSIDLCQKPCDSLFKIESMRWNDTIKALLKICYTLIKIQDHLIAMKFEKLSEIRSKKETSDL